MYETEDCQCLVPEDGFENHLTTLNKSSLQLHRLSLQKSNHASQIALEEVWDCNARLFNEEAVGTIVASANALLQGADVNAASWKTGLHKYQTTTKDLNDIFQKTIQPCEMCNFNRNNAQNKSMEKFFDNECVCELNLVETPKNKQKLLGNRNVVDEKHSVTTWHLDSSPEKTSVKAFKPKPRPKATKTGMNSLCNQDAGYVQKPDSKSFYQEPISQYERRASHIREKEFESEDGTSYYKEKRNKQTKNSAEIDFEKEEEENQAHKKNVAKITFKTARQQLLATNPAAKRTLGATRKAQAKFVSPMIGSQDNKQESSEAPQDDRLKHIDPKMVELIESEIIDKGTPIGWDDIAGLVAAKAVLQEAVVWPLLRPDMFTGLRRPPKGVLLFGPPGTGKTLIGKCVASQCNATFFSISASSLTSKWIGDGEKMVRALFAVARCYQPAVIFIDEIDSLLTQRSDTEHEATRRIKTEFLVQFDGANTAEEDRILVVGATNRPQSLDEAARRRLVKRLYIPLPDLQARQQIITNLLKTERHELTPAQVAEVARLAEGYSGADMKALCSEAAMEPIRAVPLELIVTIQKDKVRPVSLSDFMSAVQRVRASVSQADLGQYEQWNRTYGHGL